MRQLFQAKRTAQQDKDTKPSHPWSLTLLGLGLLGFTIWRSWDFLSNTMPSDWTIISVMGLFGLDIGAVIWDNVYANHATNDRQESLASGLFLLDLSGMIVTAVVDSLLYSKGVVMPDILKTVAFWVVPLIVVINVAGYFYYRRMDERAEGERQNRKSKTLALVQHYQALDDLEADKRELDLMSTRQTEREKYLLRKQQLAEQDMRLQAMEHAMESASSRGTHVEEASEQLEKDTVGKFRESVSRFLRHPTEQDSGLQDKPQSIQPPDPAMKRIEDLVAEQTETIRRLLAERQVIHTSGNGHSPDPKA